MKQVWYESNNNIAVRNVPIPPLKPNQVKVKIAYAALCATDIHMVTMGVLGAKPPMPLGHEASGVVEEVGHQAKNSGIKKGDKVSLFPVTYCGVCPACKEGKPQYCNYSQSTGAFAEYVVTDVSAVYKLPDDADLKYYSLAEPTTCAIRAMDLARISYGSKVAVSVVGGIGSILLNMLVLSGGTYITAIDPLAGKLESALKMGAQYVINPSQEDLVVRSMEITNGKGFDYIFEASGSPKAAEPTLKIMGKGGTVIYFAVYPPQYEMPLNLYDLYCKEGTIRTVFTHPAILPRAINLIPRLQMDKIIGKVLPLSQAVEGFRLFEKSSYPKILLDCSK